MKAWVLILLATHAFAALRVQAQTDDTPTKTTLSGGPAETVQVPASPLRFQNLTVNDGLSDGSVQAIVQGHLGYMWFGSGGGLDRYDGYEFVSYKYSPFDSTSMSDGLINGLYEDEDGTLWITTEQGGLNLLDPRRERFKHYYHDPDDPSSLGHDVLCKVHPSRSDAMWVCTLGGGLDRFDPNTETFQHFRFVPGDSTSLSNNYVYDAYEDPSGYTWVATGNGLNRLDPEHERFTRYFYAPEDPQATSSVPHQHFRFIHPDASDPYLLWLGSRGGLIRFETRSGRFEKYLSTSVYSIVDDPNIRGVLWLATTGQNGGLYRLDTETGRYSHYQHDPRDPESLISNRLFSIFADRSGMIWTGSANGRGISRFDPAGAPFLHYKGDGEEFGSLSLPSIWGIQEDSEGRLWVAVRDAGGRGELNRIDRTTGKVTRFAHDPADAQGLGNGAGHPLHVDGEGAIWVGSNDGLEKLDPETGRVTRFSRGSDDARRFSWKTISYNRVRTIYEDRSDILWVGTARGLTRLDRESQTSTHYLDEASDSLYMPRYDVLDIIEDRAGMIWVATADGLYRLDPSTGTHKRYVNDPRDRTTLSENIVLSLHVSAREPGVIWAGTRSGGLNRLDVKTGRCIHFTTVDGLPDNRIYAILEDAHGLLWMSTNRGLSRFDPETLEFTNYGYRDGLQSMEFNHGAAYRSPKGELFFGGPNGLNAFFPERLWQNKIPPEVRISELRLFNESVSYGTDQPLSAPVWETEDIHLRHDQNTVSFGFTAHHYKDPDRNVYAYRLSPVDDDWITSGTQRSVTYSGLNPGDYTFQVRAANSDGVWSDEPASIRLAIAPPWWRTGWAYGFYVLMFISALVAVDRIQRKRLVRRERERARVREAQVRAEAAQEKAETLQQLDVMKSRFFANLSHEFRTPLTLILDPLERMIESTDDDSQRRSLDMMRRQTHRLLHLIGQLLDLSRFDAGGMTLRARRLELVPFLRNLVYAFASRAEREDIALQFTTEKEEMLLYGEPDKLEKIFTNLLTNAFKFTPSHGKIRVGLGARSNSSGEFAEVVVKDTGEGIPADELPFVFDRFYQVDASLIRRHDGAGIGLALTRELVELHGGEISIESEPGFGTTFYVRLPLGKDHLHPEEIVEDASDAAIAYRKDRSPIGDTARWSPPTSDVETLQADAPVVLLVEDNDEVRSYVRTHLSVTYRMEEAVDGVEGVEKARELSPDLVIADVMMPRMDGYQLCETLKSDDALGHIPVILLTAKASEESKVEGLETGADDYIYKPFSMNELLVRVENLIEVRRALRRRFSNEVVIRPSDVSVPSEDAEFLERVRAVVDTELGNSGFTVERLADQVGLSTRQLYRRLKKVCRLSPGGLIRTMRLQRAADMLEQGAGNISEVAYAVGFNDPDYFSRLFRQTYGMPPSEYVANLP